MAVVMLSHWIHPSLLPTHLRKGMPATACKHSLSAPEISIFQWIPIIANISIVQSTNTGQRDQRITEKN